MPDDPDFSDPSLYINRELSWLALVRARAETMLHEIAGCWDHMLHPLLRAEEIEIIDPNRSKSFAVVVESDGRRR